jgi:hypothetical protein
MKPTVFRPFPPVFRGLFDDFFKPASGYTDTGDLLTMPAVNVKQGKRRLPPRSSCTGSN